MKSNFDFLNRYWPALAQIGATAETYVYSDPNACIYKLGMFAERLVQEILVFEHIAEPAFDNTHANRIRILKRAGLLPHEIDNTLYVLRKTRNSAVHIGTDSVDDAKTLLSLTYNLAVWFMETYGDWGYIAPEFVMPSETTHEDLESVIAEQERKIEELTKQLAVVKTAASGKTQKERARRSESVSAMMNWNEAQTRCLIDEQLRLSGWEADTQNLRYSKGTRPVKGRNIAISEWPTNSAFYKNGYADYAFFIGEKLVALMDAKKMSEDVASTIDVQVKDYAAHIKPEDIPHTVGNWNGYQVPFLLASNGRAYLEQLRTKSGIWFLDVREQENQPYPIRNWFSPSDLMEKLGQNTAAANQALAAADNSFMTDPNGLNLRDYQIKAIDKATEAIVDGKRTALLAMATGTGKTRTVLGLIYKMLESKRFRRILFLVDRVSLGEQAMDTFKDVKLKELLTLDKIYEIKAIDDNIINLETKVSISTVQGLLKRTILAEEPDLMPGAFDLIIVDEAHRGYILDREMTEEEILYDNQDDYMSKYKQVIEYFDAVKVALTATPALHTTEIFGEPVYTYSYREAVIDGWLVDHDPPYLINTDFIENDAQFKKGETLAQYDPNTNELLNGAVLDDEMDFDVSEFNRKIVLPDHTRKVLEEVSTYLNPESGEKTLIFAVNIIKTKGSNVELVSTWRTKDPGLIELWNETRNKGALITEKLVIDGPFSENIGEGVLNSEIMDEVILCLNYDGKFGLNNMNSYFQNANTETAVVWRDWKYKVGDHILFNDTDRFSLLYNNLKGRIVQIALFDSRIRFTIDVEIPLTEQDCQNDGIEFIDIIDDVTRIRFDVLDFEEEMADEDRKKAIVPFQLAYAVSIHKAQGLEYRSVKVVIPSSNAEKITHGFFYTAITRAKEKLKIYWSSETMQEVVAGFSVDTSRQKSLAIIKEKLKQDKNT